MPRSFEKGAKFLDSEFVKTFDDLKQEVMDEAENLKADVNVEQVEQDISAATKVEVDVNLDTENRPNPP